MSQHQATQRRQHSAADNPSTTAGLLDYLGAADRLNCSPRMVRELVATRELASVKVGRLVRIEPAEITHFVERHRREALLNELAPAPKWGCGRRPAVGEARFRRSEAEKSLSERIQGLQPRERQQIEKGLDLFGHTHDPAET